MVSSYPVSLRELFGRRFFVGQRFGSSPLACCSFVPPPEALESSATRSIDKIDRERQLLAGIPRRVSAFLVCQGASYCGAGMALVLWPGWSCKLLLSIGLGGSGATGDDFRLSAAEAAMTRLAASFLVGVGWFYIHGGLSERLHFLASTCLNRAVFVPFLTTLLAILGARMHLCVLFGVLDPLLTMLTYLVLLGCKDACRFCFKLLLPAGFAIAAAITGVVAATAATTTYDTSLGDWLTVQIAAMVVAMAAVTSLCLSSLRCVSGSTAPRGIPAQNGSEVLPMFEGTHPVDAAELDGSGHAVEQFGATPRAPQQPAPTTRGPMESPQSHRQQVEGSRPRGGLQLEPAAAATEHSEIDELSEAESDVELFETPAPQRTSSTGIFSPPTYRGSPRVLSQAQAAGSAQATDVLEKSFI